MHIKQKNIQNKKFIIALISMVVAFAGVGGVTFALYNNSQNETEAQTKGSGKPLFSFQGAPGWWRGATNETSMAVFDDNNAQDCFISAEYATGTVDAATEMSKISDNLTNEGYVVIPASTQTLDLQTSSKQPLRYELQQSSVVTPPGSEKLKGGQEFGYIQLKDGYIKIMGYCDEPDQLPNTIPALKAIKFDGAN